ncbi:hypothetical protein [Massilia sp. YMA4]|uniref:hypothetical protein n=1 Tax=Massilia sp. YMA4 TaxID=1593482 RepID=UPI001583E875|nr:hypothetical protein [Massilia sp. YMA4]
MDVHIQTPKITPTGMSQLVLALQYIKQSPNFALFYPNMDGITVNIGNLPTTALPLSGQVNWNPSQGLQVISDTGILGVQSPAMGLVHEIAHVIFGHNEAQATAFETRVALDLGEPTRANYGATGSEVRVQNVTQHTDNGQWKAVDQGGATKTGATYDGSTNAPNMGLGYIPTPPGFPWTFSPTVTTFSWDIKGNLVDKSHWQLPPDGQQFVPNKFDAEFLEFHLGQEDSATVAALPIELTDAQHDAAQIIGVPESAHY